MWWGEVFLCVVIFIALWYAQIGFYFYFLLEISKWFKKNVFLMVAMFQQVLMNVLIADTSIQINQKHLFHLARIGIKLLTVKMVGIFFLGKAMHLRILIQGRSITSCFLNS